MTFQEFTPRMIEAIRELVGDGYEVKVEQIVKNNDNPLTGLMIRSLSEETTVVPVHYLEPLFSQAEEGVPIRHLARLVVETDGLHKDRGLTVPAESIASYEESKDHIFCKLISAERNEERLAAEPHRSWQDLAIVYYREVPGDGSYSGEVRVTNELLTMYGVSEDVLHADAVKNTMEQRSALIEPLAAVLGGIIGEDAPSDDVPLYVLTTNEKSNGAVCAIFPEVMKEATDKIGGSFFLIPSSIHEMLLLKDDGNVEVAGLESMIQSINETMLSNEEFLSDRAYYYDAKTEVISLAAEVEAKNKQQDKILAMPSAAYSTPSM